MSSPEVLGISGAKKEPTEQRSTWIVWEVRLSDWFGTRVCKFCAFTFNAFASCTYRWCSKLDLLAALILARLLPWRRLSQLTHLCQK
ncbi:hypothetical protein KC19_4G032200 [Ceratodon purpureus]|uniref:Uncharacterized protein n=1 Tax=Ceratodon purpureus TaxID=3225 RepID=A0A8T0I4P4_CERPU|nr:hypothetical protein KC19_4G032200 [Ceratodon purpureus]